MKPTTLRTLVILLALAMVGGIALSVPQASNNRPLTWAQVLEYWKAEAAETLRRNITRERVTQMGVAFALDEAGEKELLRLKMSPDLINEIKKQNRTATLIIECEPLCSLVIDSEPVGNAPANRLMRSVIAGPISVEVSAPPSHKPIKETVTVAPGEVARRTYKLAPVGGFLDLQCEPDCVASVTGPSGYQGKVSTIKTRGSLEDLPDGEYSILVEADGFKPARSKFAVKAPGGVNANFKLAVDEWASKPATEILELITQAVGTPNLLSYAVTARNDGRMKIQGDPANIGNWTAQVVESAVPGKLHWEMNLAGRKWTVAYDGMMSRSKGDRRFSGTEFAQELEQSIRLSVNLRLPAALLRVRSNFDLKKESVNDVSVLVASSSEERYTFYVDDKFLPQKLMHERLTAPRGKVEIEFAQYRQVQPGLRLPYVTIFRYPDRPKHEQVFEYTKIDPGLSLRDSYFSKP